MRLLNALLYISATFTSASAHETNLRRLKAKTKHKLDAKRIPKFVEDLTIPFVLHDAQVDNSVEVSIRQISQQILPSSFPETTLWAFGNPHDSSTFHNPAGTIENTEGLALTVTWINELVQDPDACRQDPDSDGCNYLIHVLQDRNGVPLVDQTLHWAAPNQVCENGEIRTDCKGGSTDPYNGPIPVTVHVHGARVESQSDGYPESWFLPSAKNIPRGYATEGTYYTSHSRPLDQEDAFYELEPEEHHKTKISKRKHGKYRGSSDMDWYSSMSYEYSKKAGPRGKGYAVYKYDNSECSSTLFYHDHTVGMTRLGIYSAGAGFWLIREPDGEEDYVDNDSHGSQWRLPGPAPSYGEDPNRDPDARKKIREIPLAIQAMSFYDDGSLFYPANRVYANTCGEGEVFASKHGIDVPFLPNPKSDLSPIWNPEAFFDTWVVNGKTWPKLEVAPERYRFRILNVADSSYLNLALFTQEGDELPIYIVGAEQGMLPQVVKIKTGFYTALNPGDKAKEVREKQISDKQALLMGPGERYDVIVDFSGFSDGTEIIMINTAPDSPFQGFEPAEGPYTPANPSTTGQVMKFIINNDLKNPNGDKSTPPKHLRLKARDPLPEATVTRDLAIKESDSKVCVIDGGGCDITKTECDGTNSFGPVMAKLGYGGSLGPEKSMGMMWSDKILLNPALGSTEILELWNWTDDAHPIHFHMVSFLIQGRYDINNPEEQLIPGLPWEEGFKDTAIAYPGMITKIKVTFNRPGLYVWHCHILSHEDNEMMLPYCVGEAGVDCPAELF